MNLYTPPDPSLWQGRLDSLPGERFFQSVECIDLDKTEISVSKQKTYAFIGFSCDAGIHRNFGRLGAEAGPDSLRHALGKLATPKLNNSVIYDVGNIICVDDQLEEAQLALSEVIRSLLEKNIHPIVFGGGHEIAFGHYLGIFKAKADINLGIINFDAHFDMRPVLENNKGTSGTPFLQIAQHRQQANVAFNYLCLGIQKSANTESLFKTAEKYNVEYVFADEMFLDKNSGLKKVTSFIERVDTIYLTCCLDVFNQSIAPGVSAPQALGLFPHDVLPLLRQIVDSKKVISFDIAELAPNLDSNNITSHLAAALVADYLNSSLNLNSKV